MEQIPDISLLSNLLQLKISVSIFLWEFYYCIDMNQIQCVFQSFGMTEDSEGPET